MTATTKRGEETLRDHPINRYYMEVVNKAEPQVNYQSDPAGEWCKFFDVFEFLNNQADELTTLRAENERLEHKIHIATHDVMSAMSYPDGHEKLRQWMEQAMSTLSDEKEG